MSATNATPTVGTYSTNTSYNVAIMNGPEGAFYFMKGGTQYPLWTLLWVSVSMRTNPVYPTISVRNAVTTSNFIRMPSVFWLPTPIASDGFSSTFVETDGFGNVDGYLNCVMIGDSLVESTVLAAKFNTTPYVNRNTFLLLDNKGVG